MSDLYITPLPRGLHHVAISVIERELSEFQLKLTLIGEQVPDNEEYCKDLQVKLKKRVGSVHDDRTKRHVSVGHHGDTQIWSTVGVWEGTVWLEMETDAPTSRICAIPIIGALLACVRRWDLTDPCKLNSTMEIAVDIVRNLVKEDYSLQQALGLWRRHAEHWREGYLPPDSSSIRFRVSCVRSQSNEYTYPREDFLKMVVGDIVPMQGSWKVDLTNYDLEVVLLLLSPSCFAVALSLRPYQLFGTKGFRSNDLPTDISSPFLSGKLTSGITRLRPTNANLLLELANVVDGDVVLDPCAGIGTIPFYTRNGVGLGGDLSLTTDGLATVANEYIKKCGPNNPSTNLCAWDAASLPVRSSSIDIVVSDLPFGQQCLSSGKLNSILPMWICELARILRPGIGRAVLLCGAYGTVVDALQQVNGEPNHNWNLSSIFPVNISGLLAWVVIANRNAGEVIPLKNHQGRLRKVTAKRDQLIFREGRGKKRKSAVS